MRRPFCCDDSHAMYEDYYARQQKGDGMPVYMGAVHQRGHGLGNMIGSLFRKILPFLQHGAATALRTGARIFEDVRGGKKDCRIAEITRPRGYKNVRIVNRKSVW